MKAVRVYIPIEEFSDYIHEHLENNISYFSENYMKDTENCTFVPLKMELNEMDMSIEMLIVPVLNGEEVSARLKLG
jgi:hypothetical protein